MFWDDLVRKWRRDSRLASPRLLRGAGGHVATLPAPRRVRRQRTLFALLAILVFLAILLLGSGRLSIASRDVAPATPLIAQRASVLRPA